MFIFLCENRTQRRGGGLWGLFGHSPNHPKVRVQVAVSWVRVGYGMGTVV